jgi:hypothetical protein
MRTTLALLPVVIACVGFAIYCVVDVVRAEEVRYLPRWAWAIICLASIPLGGIFYLVLGRAR